MGAYTSQGVKIRINTTGAGTTVSSSTNVFAITSTGVTRGGAGSFVADGFSTGMRLLTSSTNNVNRVFTLKAVAATVMGFYEPATAQSSGATITLEGFAMSEIGGITNFQGPGAQTAIIDVTTLGSNAKEKVISCCDEGQVTLSILPDPATAIEVAMRKFRINRTPRYFDIKLTDQGSTVGDQPTAVFFKGYITNQTYSAASQDALKMEMTLEVSSAVHWIDKT